MGVQLMELRKSPQTLVDAFEAVVPGPPAQQRKMFGYPAAFVNGNMFMGLFAENMMIRLPEELRNNLLKLQGARIFEPMQGRAMREYVVIPGWLIADHARLSQWVAKSFEYASSLPLKTGRAKLAKATAKRAR
jgi:TfoX/Sxy family transcriptional regulator of competence genes